MRWPALAAALLLSVAVQAAPLPVKGQAVALPALAAAAHLPVTALEGKVLVLAWFATWCPWCMHEAPQLQRLYTANSDRILVIGVNVEQGDKEQAAKVKGWTDKFGWKFPVVLDAAALEGVVGKPKGLPALVVLARDGTVHQVESGEMLDEDFDDIAAWARNGKQ
jgi:thiol-disulfide isomerase/thioredoxin